jgi:hypothetical protein
MTQAILGYLPGYAFDGHRIISTGIALPPTQHIDPATGELMYYVRPLFESGPSIGMFIKHGGVVRSLNTTKDEKP